MTPFTAKRSRPTEQVEFDTPVAIDKVRQENDSSMKIQSVTKTIHDHRWISILGCLSLVFAGRAEPGSRATNSPGSPPAQGVSRTETVEQARWRFERERRPVPSHGLYEDIRGVIFARTKGAGTSTGAQQKVLAAARKRGLHVVLTLDEEAPKPGAWHGLRESVLFVAGAKTNGGAFWFPEFGQDGKWSREGGIHISGVEADGSQPGVLQRGLGVGAGEDFSTNLVTHILAREFTEPMVREALADGHYYVADDRLCDPNSFAFGAVDNQGVYTMGDSSPMFGKSRLIAITPLPAKLRLFHKGEVISESTGTNLIFEAKEPGSYRLEAWLEVGGVERPWIYSSAVNLTQPGAGELSRFMALMKAAPSGRVEKDLSYRKGPEDEAGKHKLDVYIPKEKTNAPVFFFIHGGAWRSGDRALYPPLGNRYSREGYVMVVPSYRLAPKYPHPAQIEDVAAAFAWTVKHVAEFGGDTNRIYVGGHSAGGHLAALLSLDERYLAAYKLSPKIIRGVLALSGVYNLTIGEGQDSIFGKDPNARRDASPLFQVRSGAPPFLVTYCQWDYLTLPFQARQFQRALRQAGDKAELVYIPHESHISEMVNVGNENDPTVVAAVKFMK